MITLAETEIVETAWAEHATGPGWANTFVNVLIFDRRTCQRRVEALQVDDIPPALVPVLRIAVEVQALVKREVQSAAVRR